MASNHYFDFIGSVWENLPDEDKNRMGEVWHGYEQVFAAIYQKFVENNLNATTQNLLPHATERWLPYKFTTDNFISRPATVTSTQDISLGLNLTSKYLLNIQIDSRAPVEVNLKGAIPASTTINEIIAKLNAAHLYPMARGIYDNTVLQFTSPTAGVSSRIKILPTSTPSANASEFVLGVLGEDLPITFPEYPWIYASPYPDLISIPDFRNSVRDESVSEFFVEGTHYKVSEKRLVSFKEEPPKKLWAVRSLFDQENPWNNFGFLMDIYQTNSQRYVDVLKGLWFAFWTGPKPDNVKKSLYLLFGLPTAPEEATVTAVSETLVELTALDGVTKFTFPVPEGLLPIVAKGESVGRFQPLVSGIDVLDKINKPGFIAEDIGRVGIERFLTEDATRGPGPDTDETKALRMLDEYTFLPQIQVESFIHPDINLGNVKIFLDAIKPLNKTYLFQVIVGSFRDKIDFKEFLSNSPDIDVTPNVDSNDTTYQGSDTLEDYESLDNDGLDLDQDGVLFQEAVELEVYSFSSLIDAFTA